MNEASIRNMLTTELLDYMDGKEYQPEVKELLKRLEALRTASTEYASRLNQF